MDLGLKDKVALVTGAGSQTGFGKAIVTVLAQEGCDIIVADMDLEGAKQTAAAAEALGRKAIALKADVTSFKEVKDMVKAGLEKFGRIDILVNNAGVGSGLQPFVKMTEADWDKDINVNFKGTLHCTHAVLPQMIERKSGKIINLVTAVAKNAGGAPDCSIYVAAKAAVLSFTVSLALEVGPQGINVNAIHPRGASPAFYSASGAPPEMVRHHEEAAEAEYMGGRLATGNAVAYLASDAAKTVNGQYLLS